MIPAEREAIRTQALEVLRSVRGVLPERPHASLDALIEREARRVEPRAEIAVFIVISQALAKHGLDWMDVFAPVSRFGGAELGAVLDAAEAALREA